MKNGRYSAAFYLTVLMSITYGYVFPCLDECQCDTNDEAIHCHNGRRTTLYLPENRLRGFTVIGMTSNAIKQLPDEQTILEKYPDLKAIDVEGNAQFDCESLKEYKVLKVYSDCEGNESVITRGQRLPDIEQPTDDCDFECQVKKHYRLLHDYLVKLWKMLKIKYEEMDKDKLIKDVHDFFANIAKKLNELRKK